MKKNKYKKLMKKNVWKIGSRKIIKIKFNKIIIRKKFKLKSNYMKYKIH